MSLTVAKFGGTSMGTAESMTQVAEIVEKLEGGKVVVVSATSGTTDQLLELGRLALERASWQGLMDKVIERHELIMQELGVGEKINLTPYWTEMKKILEGVGNVGELSLSTLDRLMTFGERISSTILAALLRNRGHLAEQLDAHQFVFTDNNFSEGNVEFAKTNEAILDYVKPLVNEGVVPVVTGFVAQAENGQYITLGRGGSDYTGAILAGALEADELEIWTDVDGIFNTDPRLVAEAKVLEQLSFNEAGELAYFGAKVLHPKTIKPAIEKNIPVKILNTFNPAAPGTVITNVEEETLKSVTYKKGISIINVCSAGMLEAKGFLARLFEVFAKHEVAVDVVSTSEVSVSMTVDNGIAEKLIEDLEKFATVAVHKEMAIICLVGAAIKGNSEILGKLFSALPDHDVMMVSQGASKRNITFLVKEAEAPEVVKKVFNTFFN